MKKKIIGLLIFLFLLVAIPVSVFVVRQQQELRKKAAPATTLSISPASLSKSPQETFSINVLIDTGENTVSAADLVITFDSSKLQAQSIMAGDFLTTVLVGGSVTESSASITLGSPPATPKQGTGILATVAFKVIGTSGSSQIGFGSGTQVAGVGEQGNVLVGTTPGNIMIIAEGEPTPTPTPTLPPDVTPTPSPTSPPPTPTPGTGGGSTGPSIVDPASGAVVNSNQPLIQGKGAPGSTVTVVIYSTDPITGIVTVDASGNWSYTPSSPLADGSHTINVTQQDLGGSTQTTSSTFTVQTGAVPVSGNATVTLWLLAAGVFTLLLGFGLRFP